MSRSRDRYLSMDGDGVRDHRMPMEALAAVLTGWSKAIRAALPNMYAHQDMDAELVRSLGHVRPVTGAAEPGSVRQAYGLEVPPSDDAELFAVSAQDLDDLLGRFEHGVGELQSGRVIEWMTPGVAKPLLDGVAPLAERGIRLELEETHVTVDDAAVATLRDFLRRDAEGRKSEVQVLGVISSVNMKSSYLTLDSPRQPSLRSTFPNEKAKEVCEAMAQRELVELTVLASLSSDGTLANANLRTFTRLGKRPDYRDVFRSMWGEWREMYADVPHDERGVPEADSGPWEGDE